MRRLVALAATLPLIAACGQSESAVIAVESASVAPAQAVAEVCEIEWRTISTAVEAHFAQYQVDVTTIEELVPEMLREAPTDWHLAVGVDGVPVATPNADGRCAGYEIGQSSSTAEAAGPTGVPCYFQQIALDIASNAMFVELGTRPATQAELYEREYLPYIHELVEIDTTGRAVPLDGTPCEFEPLNDPSWDTVDPECYVDLLRLILSSGHYAHTHPDTSPSAALLFEMGYVSTPILHYDNAADDSYVPISARNCPAHPSEDSDESGTADSCDVERRVLETAIEAYRAQTQTEVTSLDDLVPDYLRETPQGFVLMFPLGSEGQPTVTVEPVPGGPCDS